MRIAILSPSRTTYSTGRLEESARSRGHHVEVMDPLELSLLATADGPQVRRGRQTVTGVDAVIPRLGPQFTFYGATVVRQFARQEVYCLNAAEGIVAAGDKYRCLQELSACGVPIPATVFMRARDDVRAAIDEVGGVPVVIKLLEGSQGIGVMLAESVGQAETILESLQFLRQDFIVQQVIRESLGRDLRVVVVGERAVAAMRRIAREGEFRSNVHRGGRRETVELDADTQRMAVQAATVLGLRVAGVDLLESDQGPRVIEVNSSPGLEGIESVSGIDVAAAIIDELERGRGV